MFDGFDITTTFADAQTILPILGDLIALVAIVWLAGEVIVLFRRILSIHRQEETNNPNSRLRQTVITRFNPDNMGR